MNQLYYIIFIYYMHALCVCVCVCVCVCNINCHISIHLAVESSVIMKIYYEYTCVIHISYIDL